MNDEVLKPLPRKTHEEYSYCIIYDTAEGLFGMYVWGRNKDDAKQEFLRRVPGAKIKDVISDRP